ncbi:hypothetical protein B0J17DRAFT_634134 [Rhizoctonia solani]|nr:hypothetical protein B0J17DRAFT_634134 [Rhizoctonia solani]
MPPKGSEAIPLPKYVIRGTNGQVKCLACGSEWMKRTSLARHLKSTSHKDSLPLYEANAALAAAKSIRQTVTLKLNPPPLAPPDHKNTPSQTSIWISNDLQHLDVNGIDISNFSEVNFSLGTIDKGIQRLDWFCLNSSFSNGILKSHPEQEVEYDEYAMPLPQRILQDLDEENPDIESLQERFAELKAKSSFLPYSHKTMFLLDMLDNIPRLRLSTGHLKLIMWIMEEVGCQDMPKFYKLQQTQKQLKNLCGIEVHHYRSSQGNLFDMLDIPQLIGRANKWKEETPLDQLTPMYADGGKFYYVNKLAQLHDGHFVIPWRWITCNGILMADCWPVLWRSNPNNKLDSGLCVTEDIIHIPSTAFSSNYYDIVEHMDPGSCCFTDDSKSFQARMPNPLCNLTNGSKELLLCFIKPWCNNSSLKLLSNNLMKTTKTPSTFTLLLLVANNCAQSEVASHVCGGNHLCHKCNAGGTYNFVEMEEGYRMLFQPGKARTQTDTVQTIWDQITVACLGIEDHVAAMYTKSGIKDPTAQGLIAQLIQQGRELQKQLKQPKPEEKDAALMKLQTEWLKTQPALPFNILFQIQGLDPHQDTPVKILHTILLGVENLIGRQLKMLMQLTAFHAHDLVSQTSFSVIKSVGELGAVLWYSKIDHLEEYLADLSILVDNLLDAFAQFDPRKIITKMKLHILVDLVEDIRNHGPAVWFSTEVFECYNGVFRMCSVLSNHQAPSQDIARKMIELERFRHIASGGYWETKDGVERVSEDVQRYFESNLQMQTHLGWVRPKTVNPGTIQLQNQKQQRRYQWRDTVGGKAGIRNEFWEERSWFDGKSSTATSGDKCEVGSWVIARQNELTIIGRVEQILMDSESGYHGVIILNTFDLSENRHPVMNMPVLVQSQNNKRYIAVVSSYSVEFSLNVQHDCITLSCPNSGVENIRQERLNTTIERQNVEHRETAVFVINMHALHNAQRIRQVLPRSLTELIPLRSAQARTEFLAGVARRLHTQETHRRDKLSKKRKRAREAREHEDTAVGPST